MKHVFKLILLIMLVAFVFQPTHSIGQFFNMQSPLIDKQVPDFTLKTLSGETLSLQEFRGEDNTIVFFWATWCPHCRTQLKVLDDNKEDIAKQNIKLAIVDLGEKEAVVAKYIKKNNIDLNVFLDERSTLAEPYGLIGVPTFYFVNKEGIIEDVTHSLPDDLGKVFN